MIDDAEDMRVLASIFLELDGEFKVTAASSGIEGIRIAIEDPPDVVLLDYMMPDLGGPATLSALKENPITCGISVVFLTAKAMSGNDGLTEIGALGAIAKPFDPSSLAQKLSDMLASLL